MKKRLEVLGFILILFVFGTVSEGALMIQDDFSRGSAGSPVYLDGSSATVNNLPGTPAWTANTWVTDGSVATVTNDVVTRNAIIPVDITAGYVYTFTATMDLLGDVSSDSTFAGMGFYTSVLGTQNDNIFSKNTAGLQFQERGAVRAYYSNSNLGYNYGYGPGSHEFTVILNTTEAAWTIIYKVDGVMIEDTYIYTSNPDFQGIVIGTYNQGATVDNLTLDVVSAEEIGALVMQDDFSRGSAESPADLDGSVATVNYLDGTPAWDASGWVTDGSVATITNETVTRNAIVPVEISSGNVYTFTATMDLLGDVSSDSTWAGMGFYTSDLSGRNENIFSKNTAGLQFQERGAIRAYYSNSNLGYNYGYNTGGSYELTVVLDTTEAAWTIDWLVNGASIEETYTYPSNPNFAGIVIGTYNQGVEVDNLTLDVAPDLELVVGDVSMNVVGSTNLVFNWQGMTPTTYTVQTRESLVSGNWSNILENITGVDGDMVVSNGIDSAQAFYRIIAE